MPPQNSVCPGCKGRRLLKNNAGNPVVCPLCEGSGKIDNYIRMPRWYLINATPTAAAPTVNGALAIEAIADFELIWLMATQAGQFTTSLTDASGRAWQNLAVNNANQWGTAQRPFPMLAPLVLKAQTSLNWQIIDTSGVLPNAIQLALAGFDLYV